jgi:hypothetical protein
METYQRFAELGGSLLDGRTYWTFLRFAKALIQDFKSQSPRSISRIFWHPLPLQIKIRIVGASYPWRQHRRSFSHDLAMDSHTQRASLYSGLRSSTTPLGWASEDLVGLVSDNLCDMVTRELGSMGDEYF